MKDALICALSECTKLPADTLGKLLVRSKDIEHGDYALPCFILAKEWKLSPPECAKKLYDELTLPKGFAKAEVVGPYLNFFFERDAWVTTELGSILAKGLRFGGEENKNETIVVEFSSPNIAKPFHVGHLRTTLIGHSLSRIFEHLGYKIVRINHLGDWGTQFGLVYAGVQLWGSPGEKATIDDFLDRYKHAATLKKAQEEKTVSEVDRDKPDVTLLARDYFLKLEAGDPEATKFWKWVLDVSLEYYYKTYASLGIHFDHYTGESFYRDKLESIEKDLRSCGILENSEGALGVNLGKKLGFVRIFTEDGRSLYITRDLATADYRYKTFNPKKIYIVVAAPQNLYFQQLIEILRKMKHPVADRMQHVSYGHVPGLSTRKGIDEKGLLSSLMEEALERALLAYRSQVEKRPEGLDEDQIAQAVGLGAVFFDYLSRTNIKDFHFDWEQALSFQGDTGPYIMYALARINGIEIKAKEEGITYSQDFEAKHLTDDVAYALLSQLSRFPDAVKKSGEECEPYHVALFVLDLAKSFSSAYRSLRVVGTEKAVARARLALFLAVRNTLQIGLQLIGITPIARM